MEKNSFISSFSAFKIPFIILTLFLILELGFRMYYFGFQAAINWKKYNPQGILLTDIVQNADDPDISWTLKPNISSYLKGKIFTTNSFGFRSPEVKKEKQLGKTRIAVLGRSFTMGSGVNDNEVYTNVLQKKLDEWKPDTYEIINCGVGAYNIKQMTKHYEANISQLKPDVIFIPITHNVLTKDILEKPMPLEKAIPKITNLRYYLSFAFMNESARLLVQRFTKNTISTDWLDRYRASKGLKRPTIHVAEILSQFIQKRNSEKIKCFFYSPRRSNKKNTKQADMTEKQMITWIQKHEGAEYFETNDYIIGNIPSNTTIYFGDNHPNAEVHGLVANAIYQNMKDRFSQ